jgi:hypothetical protein
MEHVVFGEKYKCEECGNDNAVTGKVMGVELVDWAGHMMKITIYYDYCPKCDCYKITS